MAFVDVHATGEASAGHAATVDIAPRIWRRPRSAGSPRLWHRFATAAATLAALTATALFATRAFDDRLLGALSAVLLYAIAAPVAARLFQAGAHQSRLSYQGIGHPSHRRG